NRFRRSKRPPAAIVRAVQAFRPALHGGPEGPHYIDLFPARRSYQVLLAHGGVLHLGERALVMGILNITPDSFAEPKILDTDAAVVAALRMEAEGADLLDIGGGSTRPGGAPGSAAGESAPVLSVVPALSAAPAL